jgi:hypothetical protein
MILSRGYVVEHSRSRVADAAPTVAVAVLAASVLVLVLREPGITTWGLARVVATVVCAFWVPGRLALSLLRVDVRGLESLALSLVVGMVATCFVYEGLVLVGLPAWSIAFWALATTAIAAMRLRPRPRPVPRARPEHAALAAVVAAGLLVFAWLPYYWGNVVDTGDGGLRLTAVDDVVLHVSRARELTHEVPAGVPFLSGTSVAYQSGADLVGAVVVSLAGVSAADATLRFVPPLFLVTAALATFVFARWWLGSGIGAALATALVLFGEDFSFVPGLRGDLDGVWSIGYFGAPAVFGLYFVNPMLVALAIMMASLFAIGRWLEGGGRGFLVVAGGLVAALWTFKAFVGQLLLVALVVAAGVAVIRRRREDAHRLALVVLVGCVVMAPFALFTLLATDAPNLTSVGLGPRSYVRDGLQAIGLTAFADGVALGTVGLGVYLLGNLGMRVVALPGLVSERFRRFRRPGMRAVLWAIAIVGTILTLGTRITLSHDPDGSYDNAIWFYTTGKFVLWVLAVEVVLAVWLRRIGLAVVAAMAMLALSVPSALQLFHSLRTTYAASEVPAADVRLLGELDRRCTGDDVVLAEASVVRPILLTTDCETPVVGSGEIYSALLIAPSELAARVDDVAAFWRGWEAGRCDAAILERYGVSYVVAGAAGAPVRCGDRVIRRIDGGGRRAIFAAPPG